MTLKMTTVTVPSLLMMTLEYSRTEFPRNRLRGTDRHTDTHRLTDTHTHTHRHTRHTHTLAHTHTHTQTHTGSSTLKFAKVKAYEQKLKREGTTIRAAKKSIWKSATRNVTKYTVTRIGLLPAHSARASPEATFAEDICVNGSIDLVLCSVQVTALTSRCAAPWLVIGSKPNSNGHRQPVRRRLEAGNIGFHSMILA